MNVGKIAAPWDMRLVIKRKMMNDNPQKEKTDE